MIEPPLADLSCGSDQRRASLATTPGRHGIDYVEVSDDQLVITVSFIPKEGAGTGGLSIADLVARLAATPAAVELSGGVRKRGIRVIARQVVGAARLRLEVDEPGDFSEYVLRLRDPAIDPAYAQVAFSFKAGCPTRFDCGPREVCGPEDRPDPPIDYMAKDYASFRQALVDLLPTIAPDWTERAPADLGMALVELMAYTGDLLSYQQDAVANEAYLETARRRESVRRHVRLVDYPLHDGATARALLHVRVREATGGAPKITGTIASGTQVLTRLSIPIGPKLPPHAAVIEPSSGSAAERELNAARAGSAAIFETSVAAPVAEQLNEVPIHPWGRAECCVPRGATRIDLAEDLAYEPGGARGEDWRLRPGRLLLLEEVLGPATGRPADADPSHRQAVRLTAVERLTDPIEGIEVTRVEWSNDDRLRFPLCLSARAPDGTLYTPVSVARGNLVLCDHGETRTEWHPDDPGWTGGPTLGRPAPGIDVGERPYRFRLREGPLAMRLPLPAGDAEVEPVRRLLEPDPRESQPQVDLMIGRSPTIMLAWGPASTLVGEQPFARRFVVETDDRGRATLRFGDGVHGAVPPDGAYVRATYRIGVGRAGMVGADALRHLIQAEGAAVPPLPPIDEVRNPLPAWGGVDPEPIAQARRLAPAAFRARQLRAVTEDDYAQVAERHPAVQKAVATFRWTGSWHTVFLSVDPLGRTAIDPALQTELLGHMERFTQAGYDLELKLPVYVPLELELDVCAHRDHFRGDVERAVLEALTGPAPRGRTAFFDADRWTFGQALYLSDLYEAVMAVEGVESAALRRFARQHDIDPPPGRPVTAINVARGSIEAARLEVLRLDNDPSRPEEGALRVRVGGGK